MEWFFDWWRNLGLVGQIMACAAIPMTVVMLIQLILMIIGSGFGDSDSDFDGDASDDGDGDGGSNTDIARIFTIRGIVAFFALGGWAGLAALTAGISEFFSIWIAVLSGAAAMLLASLAIKFALRMQSSGNINIVNAVAKTAEVYITIPPRRSNTGKVTLVLQERFVELDAVTDNEDPIKPYTKVEVVGVTNGDCLVVRPLVQDELGEDEFEQDEPGEDELGEDELEQAEIEQDNQY